jgi:hypothetical protein
MRIGELYGLVTSRTTPTRSWSVIRGVSPTNLEGVR